MILFHVLHQYPSINNERKLYTNLKTLEAMELDLAALRCEQTKRAL